jgi:predicted dehydrogenase
MKKYGIGLIGLGMGSILLKLNSKTESGMEVRGICASQSENVKRYQKKYNVKYSVTDYRELLSKEDIDIIGVYSPDHLHSKHCIAALNAGKHVICTKPMTTSVQNAEAVAELVEKKNLKFLLGQTMRYEPQFSMVKKMYNDGDLGRILMAEAHYVHDMRPVFKATPWRLKVPKDYMYGAVNHPLDVLRWFLGDIEEVFAYGSKGGLTPEYPLMSNFLLNLKFKDGIIARVMGGFDIVHPPLPMMGLSLFGSKASVTSAYTDKKDGYVKVVFDKFENKEETSFLFPAETEGAYGHGKTVFRYLDHFEECLRENKTPSPNAREGVQTVKVCAAAWESIKTGIPIRIK